jgi:hypothetical protein
VVKLCENVMSREMGGHGYSLEVNSFLIKERKKVTRSGAKYRLYLRCSGMQMKSTRNVYSRLIPRNS